MAQTQAHEGGAAVRLQAFHSLTALRHGGKRKGEKSSLQGPAPDSERDEEEFSTSLCCVMMTVTVFLLKVLKYVFKLAGLRPNAFWTIKKCSKLLDLMIVFFKNPKD